MLLLLLLSTATAGDERQDGARAANPESVVDMLRRGCSDADELSLSITIDDTTFRRDELDGWSCRVVWSDRTGIDRLSSLTLQRGGLTEVYQLSAARRLTGRPVAGGWAVTVQL